MQCLNERFELLDLALAQVRGGMRTIELLRERAYYFRAGRVGQARQFLEVLIDVVPRRTALGRRADENRAFNRRRKGDDVATDRTFPASGVGGGAKRAGNLVAFAAER